MRSPDVDDDLPTVVLSPTDQTLHILRSLQAVILKHPAAAKAIFAGLIAEGRAFAGTPEGAAWRDRLAASELLHRARLVLDFPALSMLEPETPEFLPSAYADAVFMLASGQKPGALLDPMFRWEWGDDRA